MQIDLMSCICSCRKEIKKCKGSGGGGGSRRKRSIASQDDLAPELASRLLAATNEVELAEVVANDPIWYVTPLRSLVPECGPIGVS